MPAVRFTAKPTFRNVDGRFAKATRELLEDRRDLMRDEGRRMKEIAQDEAPKRTGEFARNIRFRTFIEGDTLGFTLSHPEPLGTFITEGTRPHPIVARGGALRFFWENGPRGPGIYFFRSVNHPGTKANPYTERAFRRWRPQAQGNLNRIATRFVSNFTGKG